MPAGHLSQHIAVGTGPRSPGLLQCQGQASNGLGTPQGTNVAPLSQQLFLQEEALSLHLSLLKNPTANSIRTGENADTQIMGLLDSKDANVLPPKELPMTLCTKISSPFLFGRKPLIRGNLLRLMSSIIGQEMDYLF